MTEDLDRPLPGNNYFVVTWCSEGLESIVDIGEIFLREEAQEKEAVFNILSDKPHSKGPLRNEITHIVGRLKMRARMNSQRNYEIYMVMTDEAITKDILEQLFEETPQEIVDMIRENGTVLLSNRNTTPAKII